MTNKYILNNRLTQQYINNTYIDIEHNNESIMLLQQKIDLLNGDNRGLNRLIVKYVNNLDTMET